MCGIAGFCDFSHQSSDLILRKMTDCLHHRGPDDSGYSFYYETKHQIGLGHRRLAIIDLSPLGHQPMKFLHYEIIFNGEIYNYNEIRNELVDSGFRFKSHSDTEVILAGFHKWGINVIDKFIGMFAFALYDKTKEKLWFVRDRVGVKPLYYYFQNNVFLFSSEIKSFHEHPCFVKKISNIGLSNYLQYGYSVCPDTIFENTFQVRPGHYIELDISTQKISETCYWEAQDHYMVKSKLHEEQILNDIDSLLSSAANYRMVADVPVGLFLSGGYDSSTIAAFLQKDRTEKIKTFTIGFKDVKYNEAPYAKQVAEYLGTDHTEYYCSIDDALNLIPEICLYFDEPFADPSSIPTMLVSELARKHVTVALSADGGDEVFAGYPKYIQALRYQKLRKKVPAEIAKILSSAINAISNNKLTNSTPLNKYTTISNKISELLKGNSAIDFARINVKQFEEHSLTRMLVNKEISQPGVFYNSVSENINTLDKLLLLDLKAFLPDDLLVKIDRSTMRVSLEGREPLLDHRLIEYMGKVDAMSKINHTELTTKYYLKKIANHYIPEKLLNRPKMGFVPPLADWLGNSLREYVEIYLSKENISSQGLFNYSEVAKLKHNFYKLNHTKSSKKIWNLLVFQMWFEKWMK